MKHNTVNSLRLRGYRTCEHRLKFFSLWLMHANHWLSGSHFIASTRHCRRMFLWLMQCILEKKYKQDGMITMKYFLFQKYFSVVKWCFPSYWFNHNLINLIFPACNLYWSIFPITRNIHFPLVQYLGAIWFRYYIFYINLCN